MPANRASLQITEAYRGKMVALRERAQHDAREVWGRIDQRDLDGTYEVGLLAVLVTAMQREAARLSSGYLQAFIQSELGRPIRAPMVDARQVGQARNGDELRKALVSPLITAKVAIRDGRSPSEALVTGRTALDRMVGLATDTAAREGLRRGMEDSPHVEGWRRAVRGTCGACMGASKGRVEDAGETLHIHPNCQCVSEPVVKQKRVVSEVPEAIRGDVDRAINAMAQTHDLPEGPPIKIRVGETQNKIAAAEYDAQTATVTISEAGARSSQLSETVLHELGHAVDASNLRRARTLAGEAWKVMKAVRESKALGTLKSNWRSKFHGDYVINEQELWARAYAQWVGEKHGIDVTRDVEYGMQWERDDFKPIADAFDEFFRDKGVLR